MNNGGSNSSRDGIFDSALSSSAECRPGLTKLPLALTSATASAVPEIKRMGAPTFSGVEVLGNALCSSPAVPSTEIEDICRN